MKRIFTAIALLAALAANAQSLSTAQQAQLRTAACADVSTGRPAMSDTTLLYVTTCTSQALTANGSNTVNFPSWDIEFGDPT